MSKRKTAGELANKALSDNTKYDLFELAHAINEDLDEHIRTAIENYRDKIDQEEFCVVMILARDPLIKNLQRRKFYCWPWLPSPRPNQCVFLYNKPLDRITKRLWVLPCAESMALLATNNLMVAKDYQTMRDWSVAFFKGRFWEFIRYQHEIEMLSQQEHFELARQELRKTGIDLPDFDTSQPFDFSKISAYNVTDPGISTSDQDS